MKLAEILFQKGKEAGFEDMEVYFQSNNSFNLKIFEGEIVNYSISDEQGLSFRGIYNQKMGYSYTEKVDETSVDMLIKEAKANATIIDSDDEEFIYEGSKEYKEVNNYNKALEDISNEEKIKLAFELEKEALSLDKRVEAVDPCIFSESSSESIVINSKGLRLEDKSNLAFAYLGVKVKDGEDIKTSAKYAISNDFNKFDTKTLAKGAVDEAVSMLGAKPVKSGQYEIILRNDISANILEAFSSIFSAEAVQKDLSLLKGKIGEKIANNLITIVDDPFLKDGIASTGFDSEGVATKHKKLIDGGVLKTFLHSLKTAKKDGVEPTGNGFKGYKSSISISPTNMYIENGDTKLEDMIRSIDRGLLIVDVQGLHSGLNTISGDFSLSAYGFLIEGGRVLRPVNQITIAGNYFEVLNDVEIVGSDLEFALPGAGYIGSPSLKIKKLSVAGE
ncbi:TldD/PmbA family protein [Gottschalkia acidurici 9a]|uniref:TldD/PmbA family protein n=1 Tax=Gottschalkia acidurici (strain ATCC 7906 / DSM 604 / BCRC 14475 / CIP 104303 / KCTC 5404 / NCIMB 10678 / 9a) TaxID=1128398 RepID=K0AZF8_GOTA9|nr:TldD/PmbA family protein [Gottschalkia acidurici]AFS77756.1 TldD/PmbA family protein [Gottschalkia acidurici 9a]